MQDNDPKHCSHYAQQFYEEMASTPPESPDLNPIENVWLKLREYTPQRGKVKPTDKEELIGLLWMRASVYSTLNLGHLWG